MLAAFAFVRLLSAVPITPGGLGLVELGLTAALGSGLPDGTKNQIAAAVLLYRALTWLLPIPLGVGVLAVLAREPELAAHARRAPRRGDGPRRAGRAGAAADPRSMSAAAEHSMFERRLHALVAGLVLLGVAVVLTIVVAADRTGIRRCRPSTTGGWAGWSTIRTPWLTRVGRGP